MNYAMQERKLRAWYEERISEAETPEEVEELKSRLQDDIAYLVEQYI